MSLAITRDRILEIMQYMTTPGQRRIEWLEINNIINFLENNTGKDLEDDPLRDPNDTLFRTFSLTLRNIGQYQMAISSFKKYYGRCLELEFENRTRIHKGDMLHWIGRSYYELKKYDEAFYYWILTFLDDVLSEFYETKINGTVCIEESLESPVAQMLELFFDIPLINLQNLKDNSMRVLEKENEEVFDPEILKYKLMNAGHQIPRLNDYRSYTPNYPYLRLMFETAVQTGDFRLWEQFAAFLFSTIDGFEPMTNLSPGDGSYEFDIIIRNCSRENLFVSKLGDYIGIECKYFKTKKVDVETLNHFASKLKYHDMTCGIIFSKTDISGWENAQGERYGKLVQSKIYNRNGIVVFQINHEDISRVLNGINLIELLIEKYESVRLGL